MGKKSRLKKEYREKQDEWVIEQEKWRRFLQDKCHYYAVGYFLLSYISPFVFFSNFELEIALLLIGGIWFISSFAYILIFRHYARLVNKTFYERFLRNRFGDGSMGGSQSKVGLMALFAFRHATGVAFLIAILGLTLGLVNLLVIL